MLWLLLTNSILLKYLRQEKRNNLCGYYICEFIRMMTSERRSDKRQFIVSKYYSQFYDDLIYIYTHIIYSYWSLLKIDDMREELLPRDRILAIQEEFAGFYLKEVIPETGEFHYS